MSRQYGKELRLFILNREGKELFEWADKLSLTLAEKVKSAIACALSGCSNGSFLWNAFYHYGCDVEKVKKELRRQYKEEGTIGMEWRWGFHRTTIAKGLQRIGIEIKPPIYNHAPYGLASEAFKKYGGIEAVLKQFGSMAQFSKVCKVHAVNLAIYLKKQGYHYNKKEGKWKVKGEIERSKRCQTK